MAAVANARKKHFNGVEFWEYKDGYKGGIKIPLAEVGEFLQNPRRYQKSAEKVI